MRGENGSIRGYRYTRKSEIEISSCMKLHITSRLPIESGFVSSYGTSNIDCWERRKFHLLSLSCRPSNHPTITHVVLHRVVAELCVCERKLDIVS
jgi:hypothetical protein